MWLTGQRHPEGKAGFRWCGYHTDRAAMSLGDLVNDIQAQPKALPTK
jgi:hypothetical protein